MELTLAQKQTIKAAIAADPVLNAFPTNEDGAFEIAKLLNLVASPDFIVWKPDVSMSEIMNNGFAWDRVDNASVGQARIWEWMKENGTINASKANIWAGIEAAWPGAANVAQRAAIYVHCKRLASRVEKLLASGTGSDAVPATMGATGPISPTEALEARNI